MSPCEGAEGVQGEAPGPALQQPLFELRVSPATAPLLGPKSFPATAYGTVIDRVLKVIVALPDWP